MQTIRIYPKGLTKDQVRAQLPKVGDVRMESPTADATSGHYVIKEKQRCVVVDVRPEHLWYTVEFENGIRESYKLPRLKPRSQGGIL